MEIPLQLSKFQRQDFQEYKSWYEDADLNRHLGPMDEEWLEYVMQETDGCQYSAFQDDELVAVVGIKFPNTGHLHNYITDLALKPKLRSKGIGSNVLRELLKVHPLKPGHTWRAFVDVKNPRAKSFFERNGWVCLSKEPNEHGMLTLELLDTGY